ncbi:MAG TPA: type II secretion system protein [Anaerolineae bacterium]|nr:type II secretion system protein [Anaerolineae bacterium]
MSFTHNARARAGEVGISLVEILIVGAISAVVIAVAGTALFQFNRLTRLQQDALTLDHQLQKAAALLGHDLIAVAEGVAATDVLTLTVPVHTFGLAETPTPLTITYSVENDTLIRDDGSDRLVVARYLDDVDFSPGPISTTLTLTLTVALREESRTATWAFSRRPSD